jgi:hypothetical protein
MKKIVLVICMWSMGTMTWAQSAPSLGSAQSFAVLGASTVTNTGPTVITGDLGVSPGTAITGFPPGTVVGGSIHAGDAVATAAQADAHTAYAALVAESCGTNLTGETLGTSPGAVTLSPGVYCFNSSAQLTGTLTLNGNGVYVFQIGSTLTTASNSSVVLANGATAGNVFWQVGSSATLGTNTAFMGSVFALISDTVTTGTSVAGSVFALTGAVTLDSNNITVAASSSGGGGGGGGQACDFTTGWGFITGPSGGHATFGFEAGFRGDEDQEGELRGHVTYTDHAGDLRMESKSVTAYIERGANSRRIQGTAEINGRPGTFQVDVTDNESGADSFAIQLSNGYSASGNLKRGHIEIHKRCHDDNDDHDRDRKDRDHEDHD